MVKNPKEETENQLFKNYNSKKTNITMSISINMRKDYLKPWPQNAMKRSH